jgi:hypothetical protein
VERSREAWDPSVAEPQDPGFFLRKDRGFFVREGSGWTHGFFFLEILRGEDGTAGRTYQLQSDTTSRQLI